MLNYFVIGMKKITSGGMVARLGHNMRIRDYISENINKEKTEKNIVLESSDIRSDQQMLNYAKEHLSANKRQIKKDSAKCFEIVVDCSKEHFKTKEEHLQYLNDSYKYLKKRFKGQKIIHATIHMDEGKPHLHAIISYFNDELGKWNQKDLYKKKLTDINEILNDFESKVGFQYKLKKGDKEEKEEYKKDLSIEVVKEKTETLFGNEKITKTIKTKIIPPKKVDFIVNRNKELIRENEELKKQIKATQLNKKQIQVKINKIDYNQNRLKSLKVNPLVFLHKGGKIIKNKEGYLILSPFRDDTSPSLSVFQNEAGEWLNYDYATGQTRNNIDSYMELNNTSYKDTIEKILEIENIEIKDTIDVKHFEELKEVKTVEVDEQDIKSESLKKYLSARGIEKIPSQLREIHEEVKLNNGYLTTYFGLGLRNDSDGFSYRNKLIKKNINQNDITTIDNKKEKTIIVEGMFDYLSIYQTEENNVNYVILNSVNNINTIRLKRLERLFNRSDEIGLFLDNDEAGEICTEKIETHIKESDIKQPKLSYYKYFDKNSKDINEDHIKKNQQKIKTTMDKLDKLRDLKDFEKNYKRDTKKRAIQRMRNR